VPGGPEFGIFVPQVGYRYEEILERARWIEELGFHSMWLMDHLYPPGLPAVPSFEAWTLATALLASTSRLRVGHLVLSNNFRHPALLAKMATSLDRISSGRLILGLGSGSVAEEHRQAGLPWSTFADRTARLGEALELVTRMLASEQTTFEGEHYTVRELPNLPPAVQQPRPPILVGGSGDRTLDLVARYADYWNCPTYAIGDLDDAVARLVAACGRIGRDPGTIRLSVEAVLALGRSEDDLPGVVAQAERRFGSPGFGLHAGGLIGTAETVAARLIQLAGRGVELFVFFLHDRVQRSTLELLAERVVPVVRQET
jgi:alkanesulfonate monooxygenase SsuD/methylene tetrahydromethanopterin reductase-like flavin-dependent oxidoreductase (luciferase family)